MAYRESDDPRFLPDPNPPEIVDLTVTASPSNVSTQIDVMFQDDGEGVVLINYEWTQNGEGMNESDRVEVDTVGGEVIGVNSQLPLDGVYADDGSMGVYVVATQGMWHTSDSEEVDIPDAPENGNGGNGDDPDPPDTAGPSTGLLLALAAVIVLLLVYGHTR